MIVGVVGGGVVGQAIARSYFEFCETRVFDVQPKRSTHSLVDVLEANVIFVCLPTPPSQNDMGIDTTVLCNFFNELPVAHRSKLFVIRSTVPIGFTKYVSEKFPNVLHSPEFLTARCSYTDAAMPSRNIIGLPDFKNVGISEAQIKLARLYAGRFPEARLVTLTSDESEAVKLFTNTVFACKVAMWNELRTLADHLVLSWDDVHNTMLLDGRIHPSHTQVPGPDGMRGFGGACLPKDLSEFCRAMKKANLAAPVAMGAFIRNVVDRAGVKVEEKH